MATDRHQLDDLRQLSSELLQHGEDVEVAALSGCLRAQRQRLEATQTHHDVSVCIVKFRPSTTLADERVSVLGKLMILDFGKNNSLRNDHYHHVRLFKQ